MHPCILIMADEKTPYIELYIFFCDKELICFYSISSFIQSKLLSVPKSIFLRNYNFHIILYCFHPKYIVDLIQQLKISLFHLVYTQPLVEFEDILFL